MCCCARDFRPSYSSEGLRHRQMVPRKYSIPEMTYEWWRSRKYVTNIEWYTQGFVTPKKQVILKNPSRPRTPSILDEDV